MLSGILVSIAAICSARPQFGAFTPGGTGGYYGYPSGYGSSGSYGVASPKVTPTITYSGAAPAVVPPGGGVLGTSLTPQIPGVTQGVKQVASGGQDLTNVLQAGSTATKGVKTGLGNVGVNGVTDQIKGAITAGANGISGSGGAQARGGQQTSGMPQQLKNFIPGDSGSQGQGYQGPGPEQVLNYIPTDYSGPGGGGQGIQGGGYENVEQIYGYLPGSGNPQNPINRPPPGGQQGAEQLLNFMQNGNQSEGQQSQQSTNGGPGVVPEKIRKYISGEDVSGDQENGQGVPEQLRGLIPSGETTKDDDGVKGGWQEKVPEQLRSLIPGASKSENSGDEKGADVSEQLRGLLPGGGGGKDENDKEGGGVPEQLRGLIPGSAGSQQSQGGSHSVPEQLRSLIPGGKDEHSGGEHGKGGVPELRSFIPNVGGGAEKPAADKDIKGKGEGFSGVPDLKSLIPNVGGGDHSGNSQSGSHGPQGKDGGGGDVVPDQIRSIIPSGTRSSGQPNSNSQSKDQENQQSGGQSGPPEQNQWQGYIPVGSGGGYQNGQGGGQGGPQGGQASAPVDQLRGYLPVGGNGGYSGGGPPNQGSGQGGNQWNQGGGQGGGQPAPVEQLRGYLPVGGGGGYSGGGQGGNQGYNQGGPQWGQDSGQGGNQGGWQGSGQGNGQWGPGQGQGNGQGGNQWNQGQGGNQWGQQGGQGQWNQPQSVGPEQWRNAVAQVGNAIPAATHSLKSIPASATSSIQNTNSKNWYQG